MCLRAQLIQVYSALVCVLPLWAQPEIPFDEPGHFSNKPYPGVDLAATLGARHMDDELVGALQTIFRRRLEYLSANPLAVVGLSEDPLADTGGAYDTTLLAHVCRAPVVVLQCTCMTVHGKHLCPMMVCDNRRKASVDEVFVRVVHYCSEQCSSWKET